MRKTSVNCERIVEEFFSMDRVIFSYSRSKLHHSEKILFRRYLKKRGKLLDLCCGAGRVAIPLAKMGFDVIGIDNNLKMIERAKRKLNIKNVKFIHADASKIRFKKEFDYVLVMEDSLELIVSRDKRMAVFKNIYNSLKDGGMFITSFGSCFYPFRIFVKLLIHNIKYIFNCTLFSENSELGLNDIILRVRKPGKGYLFFHFFTPWEIQKIAKRVGFKSFEIIPTNILDKSKNRFKNLRIYQYLKPFFQCYYLFYK